MCPGGRQSRQLNAALAAVIASCMTSAASAAEWSTRANVAPSVTYTDNVCLTSSNKKSDWVGTLTPSGAVSAKGRKASLNVSGSVQLNSLTNSALKSKGCNGLYDDREQYSPEIRAALNTVLIDNWMNLEVLGKADQNEVTSRVSGGGDDLNRTGNTNTYYRYSITPKINRRFKDWVNLSASYTWDEQFNSNSAVRDSNRHKVNMKLSNATPSKWTRSIQGRYTRVQYGENFNGLSRKDTELANARLNLAYRFSRRWAVNGYIGEEWNEYQTTLNGDKDGSAWDLGVQWTPTQRTSISVGSGDRFFGSTPRVNIQHTHRRHRFSANYRKEVTFERDLRTDDLGGFEDNIDNPSVLSNGPILDERLAMGWVYTGRRSTLSVNGNYSEQTRSEDGEQSVFKNINVNFSPQIPSAFSLSFLAGWNEDEPRGRIDELPQFDDSSKSESWNFGISLARQFNNRIGLSLNWMHTLRDGNNEFNDYSENRVTATLGIAL